MTLHLRYRSALSSVNQPPKAFDDPSLIFYYLFDDWYSSFRLFMGDNPYRAQLEQLRTTVSDRPQPDQVTTLHHIGRQLQILRRLYDSYDAILDRILEKHARRKQGMEMNYSRAHTMATEMSSDMEEDADDQSVQTVQYGPVMAADAIYRFQRLKDRIRLYALDEIKSCLEEKDSLVFMVSPSKSR
jgi:hypothetical protein